jgi:outer membrane protein, multidrug efflux system
MMRPFIFVLLVCLVLFSGCKALDPEPLTPLPFTIPQSFSIEQNDSSHPDLWWQSFDSDELNELIDTAQTHNFDLKTLKTKIAQAKARVAKEEASFFPDLGFSFGGQKTGVQTKENSRGNSSYTGSHSLDGSLSGSYTIDVWGEAKAGKQSQEMSLQAANQDFYAYTHELGALIAETWIDIIALRSEKNILDNQIKINQTLLELLTLRFVNGRSNALDVSQQREASAEASSQVPILEKQVQVLLNRLAFLCGKTAVTQIQVATCVLPEPLALPSVGIPSNLIENRPDIQAAQMRLSSALWEVTAAKADLLPSFTLTAGALFSSGQLNLFFQNWVATLAGSIAGPIFDGGFRQAEVERVRAVAQEQLNIYAKTVASAIFEVEDRLVGIQKQESYIKLLEEELGAVRLTLRDARLQYQNGQSSYLSYLIAWTRIERLERQLVGERAAHIKERIGLYRALGWKPTQQNG